MAIVFNPTFPTQKYFHLNSALFSLCEVCKLLKINNSIFRTQNVVFASPLQRYSPIVREHIERFWKQILESGRIDIAQKFNL